MKIIMNLMGGFGNMLFQFMYGYSQARKTESIINFISVEKKRKNAKEYNFLKSFNFININNIPNNLIKFEEEGHYFTKKNNDLIKYNKYENIFINGYFQSYKYSLIYFEEIKQLIFYNLSDKMTKVKLFYDFIKKDNKITITVHIRRTDYLEYSDIHHVIKNDEWYEDAIQIMLNNLNTTPDNIKLILFSDDIKYLQNMNITKKYNHTIAEKLNLDIEETFLLMSLSDNFIIPNSSYSLLSYYFRQNNKAHIVIPNKWFAEKGPVHKINDIIEMTTNVHICNI
jgi:hypothetical protein